MSYFAQNKDAKSTIRVLPFEQLDQTMNIYKKECPTITIVPSIKCYTNKEKGIIVFTYFSFFLFFPINIFFLFDFSYYFLLLLFYKKAIPFYRHSSKDELREFISMIKPKKVLGISFPSHHLFDTPLSHPGKLSQHSNSPLQNSLLQCKIEKIQKCHQPTQRLQQIQEVNQLKRTQQIQQQTKQQTQQQTQQQVQQQTQQQAKQHLQQLLHRQIKHQLPQTQQVQQTKQQTQQIDKLQTQKKTSQQEPMKQSSVIRQDKQIPQTIQLQKNNIVPRNTMTTKQQSMQQEQCNLEQGSKVSSSSDNQKQHKGLTLVGKNHFQYQPTKQSGSNKNSTHDSSTHHHKDITNYSDNTTKLSATNLGTQSSINPVPKVHQKLQNMQQQIPQRTQEFLQQQQQQQQQQQLLQQQQQALPEEQPLYGCRQQIQQSSPITEQHNTQFQKQGPLEQYPVQQLTFLESMRHIKQKEFFQRQQWLLQKQQKILQGQQQILLEQQRFFKENSQLCTESYQQYLRRQQELLQEQHQLILQHQQQILQEQRQQLYLEQRIFQRQESHQRQQIIQERQIPQGQCLHEQIPQMQVIQEQDILQEQLMEEQKMCQEQEWMNKNGSHQEQEKTQEQILQRQQMTQKQSQQNQLQQHEFQKDVGQQSAKEQEGSQQKTSSANATSLFQATTSLINSASIGLLRSENQTHAKTKRTEDTADNSNSPEKRVKEKADLCPCEPPTHKNTTLAAESNASSIRSHQTANDGATQTVTLMTSTREHSSHVSSRAQATQQTPLTQSETAREATRETTREAIRKAIRETGVLIPIRSKRKRITSKRRSITVTGTPVISDLFSSGVTQSQQDIIQPSPLQSLSENQQRSAQPPPQSPPRTVTHNLQPNLQLQSAQLPNSEQSIQQKQTAAMPNPEQQTKLPETRSENASLQSKLTPICDEVINTNKTDTTTSATTVVTAISTKHRHQQRSQVDTTNDSSQPTDRHVITDEQQKSTQKNSPCLLSSTSQPPNPQGTASMKDNVQIEHSPSDTKAHENDKESTDTNDTQTLPLVNPSEENRPGIITGNLHKNTSDEHDSTAAHTKLNDQKASENESDAGKELLNQGDGAHDGSNGSKAEQSAEMAANLGEPQNDEIRVLLPESDKKLDIKKSTKKHHKHHHRKKRESDNTQELLKHKHHKHHHRGRPDDKKEHKLKIAHKEKAETEKRKEQKEKTSKTGQPEKSEQVEKRHDAGLTSDSSDHTGSKRKREESQPFLQQSQNGRHEEMQTAESPEKRSRRGEFQNLGDVSFARKLLGL